MIINELFSVKNKRALVTGSSKGLGKAMATCLAVAGADVIMTSRNMKELEVTRNEIAKIAPSVKLYTYVEDHSDWKHGSQFAQEIINEIGWIDILINNAGTGLLKAIEDMKYEEWDYIMSLNISNQMALSRAFVPGMKENGWGRIINTASLFGVVALQNRTAYCTSKGAVISFTRALALELAPNNITVNCISCGPMRTPLMENSWVDPVRRQYFTDLVPLGRWGAPEDVIGTILLLASDAGSYITGQNILIDGGASSK